MSARERVGIVVIGRNEGDRLKRCFASIPEGHDLVYVDSGSTDDSIEAARDWGADVAPLDLEKGFTAARARNAGLSRLAALPTPPGFIQMVDGDCELHSAWIERAVEALVAEPELAVVFGRRRERFPERSIYNRLCDDEWNVPIGYAAACGGDALFRTEALLAAKGYNEMLIAGEEPDLCLRMRAKGWKVRRIDAEMTLHDAAMLHFGQWWRRAVRSGHAYTEHVWRHRGASDPGWRRQLRSIVFWGALLPSFVMGALVAALVAGEPLIALSGLIGVLLYGVQWARIAWRKHRSGTDRRFSMIYGALMMVGKFAEFGGAAKFLVNHLRGSRSQLIEYKGAGSI